MLLHTHLREMIRNGLVGHSNLATEKAISLLEIYNAHQLWPQQIASLPHRDPADSLDCRDSHERLEGSLDILLWLQDVASEHAKITRRVHSLCKQCWGSRFLAITHTLRALFQ